MKTGRMVFILASCLFIVLAAAVLLYSCSSEPDRTAPLGAVALYITDDISEYRQVIATIGRIDLRNTVSGASCVVSAGSTTLDIANLAGVMQLINVSSCPAVHYNRIHIEFAKRVDLRDQAGSDSACRFASYKDDHNNPNVLACGADTCTLDINGAITVLAGQQHKLALDFDLKDFEVTQFGDPLACIVTMKVSPVHAGEIAARGHPEALTGLVSGLSTTGRTFTITRGNTAFTVLYSEITTSQQPGIDSLLRRSQDDLLRVKVLASQIDLANRTVIASSLVVKVEGAIAAGGLDAANHIITVSYGPGRTIDVDYGAASVEGVLAEGAWLEVKLTGFDGANFLAASVEVETSGTMTED